MWDNVPNASLQKPVSIKNDARRKQVFRSFVANSIRSNNV